MNHYIIVGNLADSIKKEAEVRNIPIDEPRPAYNIGLAMCVLNSLFIIPLLDILALLAGFICWIIYWNKIAFYKRILLSSKYGI